MHKSVLLNETIENLNIKDNLIYVDATLGYAGHSREVLKRINKGFLFAFAQDKEAIAYSEEILGGLSSNFEIIHSNFKNIKNELSKRDIKGIDGIMFDLGVSSPQLDNGERGFSYHNNAKLDMRMNKEDEISAYDIVNNYSEDKLTDIFYKYGEEKYARSISKNIISNRKIKTIETTLELVEIIKQSVPAKYTRDSHPARKVFQAIRIEVNKEIEILEKSIIDAIELLNVGGRICIITFHSLEDRIVKNVFKKYSDIPEIVKGLPNIPEEYQPKIKLIKKITPSREELDENNRSRSATLRIAEKIRK